MLAFETLIPENLPDLTNQTFTPIDAQLTVKLPFKEIIAN
jgi:hypothetical protein